MKNLFLLVILMIFGQQALCAEESAPDIGRIRVKVAGLKNDLGDLRIALFNSKTGFPGKSELAFSRTVIPAEGETHVHLIEQVPYGTYAVAVFHDENRNGKLDTNFLGIPKEAVGASNNPKSRFGPPSFDDAKFVLDRSEVELEIRMR